MSVRVTLYRWDSVTYPLDILGSAAWADDDTLGFSHLSP